MSEASELLLARAAQRAGGRSAFVAHTLDSYLAALGGADEDLAAILGVSEPTITRLKLCRRPEGDWNAAIVAIAKRLGVDMSRLANLLNAAEAVVAVKGSDSTEASTLLAARRRQDRGLGSNDGPS